MFIPVGYRYFLPFPRFLHLEQATQQVMSKVIQSDVIAMMTPRFEDGTYWPKEFITLDAIFLEWSRVLMVSCGML